MDAAAASLDNDNTINNGISLIRPLRVDATGESATAVGVALELTTKPTTPATTSPLVSSLVPSYRTLFIFVAGTVAIWLSEPLLSLIDTTVVGLSSSSSPLAVAHLAAMGPATVLNDLSVYSTYFIALTTTSQLTAAVHSQEWRRCQQVTSHVLGVALVAGCLISVALLLGGPSILNAMIVGKASNSHSPATLAASRQMTHWAVQYCWIRAAAAPAAVVGMVAQAVCLATVDVTTPVVAVLTAAVVNVCGDLLWRHHHLAGVAAATALASCASCAILLRAVHGKLRQWRELELLGQQRQQQLESQQQLQQINSSSTTVNPLATYTASSADITAITTTTATINSTTATASTTFNTDSLFATTDAPNDKPVKKPLTTTVPAVVDKESSSKDGSVVSNTANAVFNAKNNTTNNDSTRATTFARNDDDIVPRLSLPQRQELWTLVRLSMPLAFNMWTKMACYFALTVKATEFGSVAMASHNILLRIFFFFACFGDALSQTAQSFLPATLYPVRQETEFRRICRRIAVVAVGVAGFNYMASRLILWHGGSIFTNNVEIITCLRETSIWTALALALHPIVVAMSGTVIATRNFDKLVKVYTVTAIAHFLFLFRVASSFAQVWQALVVFQMVRLLNYLFWNGDTKEKDLPQLTV